MREALHEVVEQLCANRDQNPILHEEAFHLPNPQKLDIIMELLRNVLFPGYYDLVELRCADYEDTLTELHKRLSTLLSYAYSFQSEDEDEVRLAKARQMSMEYIQMLPGIQDLLLKDLEAMYDGDPAANSMQEILLAYPTFQAIMVHRLAHGLFLLKVPFLPRMMAEYSHRSTGVDIHPGATIGEYFMLDHGTGVVIGETCEIGDRVKVYQGVTLGALSLSDGRALYGEKRHPTIEDDVTLYANCTVLGGETVIGEGATIGGGAFVTRSVEAGKQVLVKFQTVEK